MLWRHSARPMGSVLLGALLLGSSLAGCAGRTDRSGDDLGGAAGAPAEQAPATAPEPATPAPTSTPDPQSPTPTPAPVSSEAEVPRLPVAEARALQESGAAVLVDVRDSGSYGAGHIAGALHIPLGEIPARAGELPRDKRIIAYCSWPNEHTSARAAFELQQMGHAGAAALLGGFQGWRSAGYPVE